jgi:exodeoxyribonuclease VII large subunit
MAGPITPPGGGDGTSGAPTASSANTPWSVSQLSAKITGALERGLPDKVRVVGEVSGFRERTHWYFDLKDEESVVSCAMFANATRRAVMPVTGNKVVVTGRIDYYTKQGKVTLIVETLEPVGQGALDAALRKLVEEARALGWLAPERKRTLPQMPRRVAIITSRSGAALQDVLVTMKRRCPGVEVVVVDVRVQGDDAVPEIVEAIELVGRRASKLGIDALLVTRGGGSMEDLWCFNHREVARAIVECPIPVVAAIGHETDTTLAELVADERCATPTQAAMRLAPDRDALLREVEATQRRLTMLMQRALREAAYRLDHVERFDLFAQPAALVAAREESIDSLAGGLDQAIRGRLARERERLAHAGAGVQRASPAAILAASRERLDARVARLRGAIGSRLARCEQRLDASARELRAVGPAQVLSRGYSVTLREDGAIVRATGDAPAGAVLTTRLADGTIRSRVEGQAHHSPSQSPGINPGTKPRVRLSPKREDARQGGLFG